MKRCPQCNTSYPTTLEYFHRNKGTKDGLRVYCKECHKQNVKKYAIDNKKRVVAYKKEYREKNKERLRTSQKQHYAANKEKMALRNKKYRDNNKERISEQSKKYREQNKNKLLEKKKEYYQKNKEKFAEYHKQHYLENSDKIKARTKEWKQNNKARRNKQHSEKMKSDLRYAIEIRLRTRVYMAIKKQYSTKAYKTKELIGCEIYKVIERLKTTMTPDMSWDNFLSGELHIDHIKPCAAFDLTDPEQQRECFHYKNLQLMWAEDNMKKGSKVNIGVA